MKKYIIIVLILLVNINKLFAYSFSLTIDNQIFYFDIDIDNEVIIDYNYDVTYTGNITIPSTVEYDGITYNVKAIKSHVFSSNNNIDSVWLPNTIKYIEDYTFSNCENLKYIKMSNSIESIGYESFANCVSLTSIEIPSTVTFISEKAFDNCTSLNTVYFNAINTVFEASFPNSITSFIFGNKVQNIPNNLCNGLNAIQSITIPESVNKIGISFQGCDNLDEVLYNAVNVEDVSFFPNSITKFIIGTHVNKIPNYMCSGLNKLTTINIPNSVTSIGKYAFDDCTGLTVLEIPNSVTFIGNYAFSDCASIVKINIPNKLSVLSAGVFNNCSGLKSITIPSSITNISSYAFDECILDTIYVLANNPPIIESGTAFYTNYYYSKLIVPNNSVNLYANADYWKKFLSLLTEATKINNDNYEFTSVTIQNGEIIISNPKNLPVIYYDSLGHVIKNFELKHGIYFIQIGSYIKKIVL